jgi:hypothetical protein
MRCDATDITVGQRQSVGPMELPMSSGRERRRFPRFDLEPMYTTIAARLMDDDTFTLDGHAYDVSEGGLRFELDRPIAPGTKIAFQITLPTMQAADRGPGRAVFVFAHVVWIEDEDEPGPYKMAAVFSHWARAGDRERLMNEFRTGVYRVAA